MLALQKTAVGLNRDELGILKTQKLIAKSALPDVLKLARTFDANQSTMAAVMAASKWTEQIRSVSEYFAPSLAGMKLAAERARMLDMMTLRASAGAASKTAMVVATEHVLEAHRLIEAIGQAESPEQSAGLFVALVSLMAKLFTVFGENTLKELRGIGAIKLIELFMVAVAIFALAAPADLSTAEKKVVAEMRVEVETLHGKLNKILAANMAADEAYVSDLPRAELRRDATIRREARGKAPALMHGHKGMLVAIKESRGQWRLVVYRDPLTEQLSEGWVYTPALQLLDPESK